MKEKPEKPYTKEEEENASLWYRLPESIVIDILSRLPLKSLMIARCVRKDWNFTISTNTYLKNLHISRSPQFHNPDIIFSTTDFIVETENNPNVTKPRVSVRKRLYIIENIGEENESVKPLSVPQYLNKLEIVGSCNGLLCFKDDDDNHDEDEEITVYVCNPFTKETDWLPCASSIPFESQHSVYAFGFDYSGGEYKYKVLRLVFHSLKSCLADCKVEAEVCTLGSSSWRRIGEVPFRPFGMEKWVCLDGGMYCIAKSILDSEEIGIGYFNVKDECFVFDPLLPGIGPVWNENIDIGVLEGELSIVNYFNLDFAEVWTRSTTLGKEGEVCWTAFSTIKIDDTVSISLVCLLRSKEILLLSNNKELVFCHAFVPSNEDARELGLYGMSEKIRPFAHFGSLISPIMGCTAE